MKVSLHIIFLIPAQVFCFSQDRTSGAADIKCQTRCEYSDTYISCPGDEVISITSAMFGRQDQTTCPSYWPWNQWSTDCQAAGAMAAMETRCRGKNSCQVKADISVFGDPCDGTEKYLKVCYSCRQSVTFGREELGIQNGHGDVFSWVQRVDGLENWEKNLQLGNAYIKTSATLESSRAKFTLGLLALHNFMYDQAVELFTSALNNERQKANKDFPMANWGIAMASKYMFWSSSNCQLGKKAVVDIPENYKDQVTDKEASFIAMAFALFPPNKECNDDTEDERENRFTEAALENLNKNPGDFESTLFYGMGKLATLNHAEYGPGTPKYTEGLETKVALRGILNDLYAKHPTHSGLIHYVIHVHDTPEIFEPIVTKFLHDHIAPEDQSPSQAENGIKASYAYGEVAKSSTHGLHMPSHIFLRDGNWRWSLKSNLDSIMVWDENAVARNKDFSYDRGNLYHSIEYAQNDLIQLGRYKEARQQFKRMEQALQSQRVASQDQMDENVRWYLELVFRMRVRDVLFPYPTTGEIPRYGETTCLPDGETVVNDDISAAQMTYAAMSEAGAMLLAGIGAAKDNSPVWKICIKELEQLSKKLEGKKYGGTMKLSKQAIPMMKEQLKGVVQMMGILNGNIAADDDSINLAKTYFQNAIAIQDQMKQTYLTVTLLFIPSYELYGQVLIMLEEYEEATEMFEKSLLNTMGRTNSLVGLARSHAMLGHEEDADYFYGYVKDQLSQADEGNLYLQEINQWFKTKSPQDIRPFFAWPLV